MRFGGNAAAVIHHPATTIGKQIHLDPSAVTLHRFVHRVIDHLPDEVMKPTGGGRADKHARPQTDGFEALEHRNVVGAVGPSFSVQDHGRASSGAALSTGRRILAKSSKASETTTCSLQRN